VSSFDGILGNRRLRRIERETGVKAERGWARHSWWEFRDADDQHYSFDPLTGEWSPIDVDFHYSSCARSSA